MDVTIDSSLLSPILSELQRICTSRSVSPILSGIKIEANHDGLKLTGGNSELFIERTILFNGEENAKVIESGIVVVHAKRFSELVKRLPGDVQIQSTEKMESSLKWEKS